MSATPDEQRADRAMLEKTLQELVRRRCLANGWRYYHTHRSKHSPAGFPDVCAVRGERLLFAELKRETEKPTPEQQAWLDDLTAAGVEVHLWRPSDLRTGVIDAVLRRPRLCAGGCGRDRPARRLFTRCPACELEWRRANSARASS